MEENQKEETKEELSIEDLRKKLEEGEQKKAEYLAGWQRARADFLNHKKEEIERVEGFLKYAIEEWILNALPIMDNFEKAEKEAAAADYQEKEGKEIIEGFLQIKNQFQDFLKSHGVEEIKAEGEKLDLNLHEVVGEAEVEDKESGTIIEETQKGYKINGRLLRPAKVKIAK